jgi:hypothetical protein
MRQLPQTKSKTCQNARSLVLPELRERKRRIDIGVWKIAISFVKCGVDGCSRKLQPILKVDPRDRDRKVKLLSPTAIAQAAGTCGSLAVGPFRRLAVTCSPPTQPADSIFGTHLVK